MPSASAVASALAAFSVLAACARSQNVSTPVKCSEAMPCLNRGTCNYNIGVCSCPLGYGRESRRQSFRGFFIATVLIFVVHSFHAIALHSPSLNAFMPPQRLACTQNNNNIFFFGGSRIVLPPHARLRPAPGARSATTCYGPPAASANSRRPSACSACRVTAKRAPCDALTQPHARTHRCIAAVSSMHQAWG